MSKSKAKAKSETTLRGFSKKSARELKKNFRDMDKQTESILNRGPVALRSCKRLRPDLQRLAEGCRTDAAGCEPVPPSW